MTSVLGRLRDPAQRYAAVRKLGRRLGFHVVRADFYSPIPDLDELPRSLWDEPADMPGVDLRIEPSLDLLEQQLAPFIAEYAPPDRAPGTRHGYYRRNRMYPAIDGEVLYALIRHLRPRNIVEIGAGWSSLVIADALARNAEDPGDPVDRRIFDPYPSPVLDRLDGTVDVVARRAEDMGADAFAHLGDGDVLFIDTTHTVRPGNDVMRLLLEVVPELASGVVVHIHDFFRPFEYPRFLYELGYYWQEHHLIQAFLTCNADFEVLIANHAIARLHPERVGAVIDGMNGVASGSALWLRRR